MKHHWDTNETYLKRPWNTIGKILETPVKHPTKIHKNSHEEEIDKTTHDTSLKHPWNIVETPSQNTLKTPLKLPHFHIYRVGGGGSLRN